MQVRSQLFYSDNKPTMASKSPLISLDLLLARLMDNKSQIEARLFFRLLNSSESLRLLLDQIVAIEHNEEKKETLAFQWNPKLSYEHSTLRGGKEAIVFLIEKGVIAPYKVQEQLRNLYGGLSRKNLLFLLEKYKAGRRNLGAYMLIRAWKRSNTKVIHHPEIKLEQTTLDYVSQAIAENRADFFYEIADTINFFKEEEYQENGEWNHDP